MRPIAETDKLAYQLAKDFLPSLHVEGVTPSLVEKYLNPANLKPKPETIHGVNGLYRRFLESAQNANMKAAVIGRSIDGVENLGIVLEGFDPVAVLEKYPDGPESILSEIKSKIQPRGQIRQTSRSIWPRYCQTILSAASFLQQFGSAEDFYRWVEIFDDDDRKRASLPMLLDHEIRGFGFALSCDFLKELGYVNFPKPDVHLRDIFTALELCPKGTDDYQLFKSIVRLAGHAGVSPYNADKVFWLVGSGYFYDDLHIGNKGRIGGRKQDFIRFAKSRLRG